MSFAIIVGISTVCVLYVLMNISFFVVLTTAEIEKSIAVATVCVIFLIFLNTKLLVLCLFKNLVKVFT